MKSRPGYTLIELLIYISIVSIALIVFMNFMTDVSRNAARFRVAKDVSQNARIVMDSITRDVRNASSVTVPNSNTLSLQVGGNPVQYALSGNAVMYNATPLTSSNLSSALTFAVQNNEVSVHLVVSSTNSGTPSTTTLDTVVIPRQQLYL